MDVAACYRQAHISAFSAVHYKVSMRNRVPHVTAEKVPIAELMLDLRGTKANYADGTDVARGSWHSLYQLKRDWPEFADFWREIKESGVAEFTDGDIWSSAALGHAVESETESWGDTSGRHGLQFYDRGRDRAFLVTHQFCDVQAMTEVRMPGEVATMWAQMSPTDQEMPFEDFDDIALSPALESRMPPPPEGTSRSVAEAMGWLCSQSELLIQQQEAAAAQASEGQAPEPFQPMAKIFRRFDRQQMVDFRRGYLIGSGGRPLEASSMTEPFDVALEEWTQGIYVGDKVLRVETLAHGMPTILPLVCYAEEGPDGQQLPVSSLLLMRDAQIWRNAIANSFVYALAVMTKVQFIGNRNSISADDASEIEEGIAAADPILWLDDPNVLQEMPGQRRVPPGIEQAMAMADGIVEQSIGQTEATLGQLGTVARTAHRLVQAQADMAQATTAEAEDHLRAFRKRETRLLLSMLFTYFTREDFMELAGEDYAEYIPLDRSKWWEALDWSLVADEEPKNRHTSMAVLELIGNSILGQKMPDKAVAELAAPAIGAKSHQAWMQFLESQEFQVALATVSEQMGVAPEDLMAAAEQLTVSGEANA